MNDPFYLLTPDELMRVNTQISLLKRELERNVLVEPDGKEIDPGPVDTLLDSISALEELQKESVLCSVYELIEKPPFQPDINLNDLEVGQALIALQHRMSEYGILLTVLAPEDYSDRTIYRFMTNELFLYEIAYWSEGETTQFIYEEFHPNHRYTIVEQGNRFIKMVAEGRFDQLNRCLAEQFLDRHTIPFYQVSVQDDVTDHLNNLIEEWWPHTLQNGSVENVLIADDSEMAQATLLLNLGVEGDPNYLLKTGRIFFSRYDLWWVIEQVEIGEWVLK